MTCWTGVRWSLELGWELRCEYCARAKVASWWPLTLEFWNPDKGMTRCRACWNAYVRAARRSAEARARRIAATPPRVLAERQEERRAYHREWAARNRAEKRADEGRQRYERRKKAA